VRRRRAVLGLALLAVACGGSAARRDRAQEAASWLATTRAVVEEWGRGTVPQSYAESSLESTADMILRERESMRAQGTGDAAAAEVDRLLGQAAAALERVREVVRAGERPRAALPLGELATSEAALRRWSESEGNR
jgi:hypothetical protein